MSPLHHAVNISRLCPFSNFILILVSSNTWSLRKISVWQTCQLCHCSWFWAAPKWVKWKWEPGRAWEHSLLLGHAQHHEQQPKHLRVGRSLHSLHVSELPVVLPWLSWGLFLLFQFFNLLLVYMENWKKLPWPNQRLEFKVVSFSCIWLLCGQNYRNLYLVCCDLPPKCIKINQIKAIFVPKKYFMYAHSF